MCLHRKRQTDSTRAKNLELIIQQRVNKELQKHLDSTTSKLSSLSESISQEPDTPPKPSKSQIHPSLTEKPLLNRIADTLTGSNSDPEPSAPQQTSEQSSGPNSNAIQKELQELRKKLDARPKVKKEDAEVEKAKSAVVECLRKNDKKPLDCWKEVETFKAEVARLERSYVASIV